MMIGRIQPENVIKSFRYSHPIFGLNRKRMQARHAELINQNQSSFCGAYWGNGFHEDGVKSAFIGRCGIGRSSLGSRCIMNSCLYEGRVRHRRRLPKPHCFNFNTYMLWLDLDELDRVFSRSLALFRTSTRIRTIS